MGKKDVDVEEKTLDLRVREGEIYGKDTMLVTEDFAYPLQLMPNIFENFFTDDFLTTDAPKEFKLPEFKENVAYLQGDYFYLYRGKISKKSEATKPGIYLLSEKEYSGGGKKQEFIIIDPKSEEEQIKYSYEGRIQNLDPDAIVEQLKGTKQILKLSVPGSSKIFVPEVSLDDDLLKRAIKEILIQKNVDIDQYRDRFKDKNALFNFKQVLKKDGAKLSMLLFERGCEALNLKYAIVIEEADPDVVLGVPLRNPIRIASDDTYEL